MNEEPTIERAVQTLVRLLDDNVFRQLIRTSQLDAPVVKQAEEVLGNPELKTGFEDATSGARDRLVAALREWVEQSEAWMHRSSST